MESLQVKYWDVFPKAIKVSRSDVPVSVPLSIRGNPSGTMIFESNDPAFASVNAEGVVSLGVTPGACEIVVYDSQERDSIRYVLAEVVNYGKSNIEIS